MATENLALALEQGSRQAYERCVHGRDDEKPQRASHAQAQVWGRME